MPSFCATRAMTVSRFGIDGWFCFMYWSDGGALCFAQLKLLIDVVVDALRGGVPEVLNFLADSFPVGDRVLRDRRDTTGGLPLDRLRCPPEP